MTRLQKALGFCGLIPFIALALALTLGIGQRAVVANALNLYAFGIGSFMLGSWWRVSTGKASQICLSNALFLLFFFALVLIPVYFPLIAAVVFLLTYGIEQHTQLVDIERGGYGGFRKLLIAVVIACLFASSYSTF